MRDIDTAVADSLKVLDPNRPIREADIIRSTIAAESTECPTADVGEELDGRRTEDVSPA